MTLLKLSTLVIESKAWMLNNGEVVDMTGIKEKFVQNALLMTKPKILAEATNDKLWGTRIPLRDFDALKEDKWFGRGWLSEMLHTIRDT